MLSQALEKDTIFKVIMQIPPALLSPMVCTYLCLQVHSYLAVYCIYISIHVCMCMSCSIVHCG